MQSAALSLRGHPWRQLVSMLLLPGLRAELPLLPLATAIVLVFDPQSALPLVLLGATYLLIAFRFGRSAAMGLKLEQRIVELETLNRSARALAHSLQLPKLIDTISRETAAAIPEATVVATGLLDSKHELVFDVYLRERDA